MDAASPPPRPPVPIRSLGPAHRERIAGHLLSLDMSDRYLRFGYPATDEQIRRYVERLDFERDDIFGIYNRRLELIAVAHLAYSQASLAAEFGVSVLPKVRGRGYGARLFERAILHARNEGVEQLFIQALTENIAMLKIARRCGATLERHGSETEAWLRLPPATLDSRMSELIDDQVARTDYRIKRQLGALWRLLTGWRKASTDRGEAGHKPGR